MFFKYPSVFTLFMIGLLLAFGAAVFESFKDVVSKHALKHDVNEYFIAWALRFFTFLLSLPLILFSGIPVLGDKFWLYLFIDSAVSSFITVLYMKAISQSDLSITVPMINFTPIFLLITAPLIVGEFPKPLGLLGVIFIVFGSYVLNIKEMDRGYFSPFQALLKERGPKIMLIVAFLFSFSSPVVKIGVQNSSPFFWTMAVNGMTSFILLPLMLYRNKNPIQHTFLHFKSLLILGVCSVCLLLFQLYALTLTLVVYAVSVKRLSTMLSVIWGHFILKETGMKQRLPGVLIMILGVFLIAISQVL